MANQGLEFTYSNEETVEIPPPPPAYPYTDDGREPFSDEATNKILNDLERTQNENEFEHTLSELNFSTKPFEEYDTADDIEGADDSTIASEEPSIEEKRNLLPKKRNLIGLLALALFVIVAALGIASVSKNKSANGEGGDLAISQANSAVTESSATDIAESSTVDLALIETREETTEETTEDTTEETTEDTTEETTEDTTEEITEKITEETTEETPATEPSITVTTEDPEPSSCSTIYDLACSTEGLETLCALIAGACSTPGLENICDTVGQPAGTDSFTIFAPNNSAFDALSRRLKNAIQNPLFLSDILLYHGIKGKVLAADLVCDTTVTMANTEDTMTLCNEDGDFFQTGSGNFDAFPKIVTTDVNACNGVIHVIDQVILPSPNPAGRPAWQNPNGFPVSDWNDNVSNESPGVSFDTTEQLPGDQQPENTPLDSDSMNPGDGDQDIGSCQDEVTVSKDCYTFGEAINIAYTSCSPSANNWVGVFRQGSSDPSGRMRQKAAYWEMPCGGHNLTCADPMESGTMSMYIEVPPGRYQVHNIGDTTPPYFSSSASPTFVIANRCSESSASGEPSRENGHLRPHEPQSPDEPSSLKEPMSPHEPDSSNEALPSHR